MSKEFTLGTKLRDVVSGFEGVACARIEYLTGCVQYSLIPPAQDGKFMEGQWFDAIRLVQIDATPVVMAPGNAGGPVQHAPRGTYRG
jgi:hypothetical protein